MQWSVAQAKQQFSEVVRLAAGEPQTICKRTTPVAVVLGSAEFEAFRQWKEQQRGHPLMGSLERLRAELEAAGLDGIEIEARALQGRPNAFEQMLDEDYAPPAPAAPSPTPRQDTPPRGAR